MVKGVWIAALMAAAHVWTAELNEADAATMYVGRRGGGKLQTSGSFMLIGSANRSTFSKF